MSKILVIIDMQNDFIRGSLGTPEAQAILPRLVDKIKNEPDTTRFIFTKDTHSTNYLSTPEGKKLPITHCIYGAAGWDIPECLTEDFCYSPLVIEKPTFGSYELMDYLEDFLKDDVNIDTIEFVGLCTDICVVSNVLMAKARFYNECEIAVDSSCCAGVTPESHEAALQTMRMCQINVY
jgi:nicotinamidase-related amidase